MSTSPSVSFDVAQRFHSLRRNFALVRVCAEIGFLLAAALLAWLLLAAGDFVWEWPTAVRRVFMTLLAAAFCAAVVYRLYRVFSLNKQRQFASFLESRFPQFGQRLRTVLETIEGRVKGPEELLSALGHQTLGRWETAAPAAVVQKRNLAMAVTGCVLLGITLFWLGQSQEWNIALGRALGYDQPYTTLIVTPENARIIEGQPVEVSLELKGRTNRSVTLLHRVIDEENAVDWLEVDLLPADADAIASQETESDAGEKSESTVHPQALFLASLGSAEQPLEYQFRTSAGSSSVYRIDVEPLIRTVSLDTYVIAPEYTGIEPRHFDKNRVTVLQNSQVQVALETNHPLAKAQLLVGPRSSQLEPVELPESDSRTQWSFALPTDRSLYWRFEGEGTNGVPMATTNGRLKVRHDSAPKLRWRGPPNEIEVHTLTELPMEVDVSDDYGLVEAGIVFQLGDEEEFVLTDWSAAEGDMAAGDMTTGQRLAAILPLESFGLTPMDFVAYYAYAIDNREGAPRRSESDLRYIDIRPLRQYISENDAAGNGQDIGGGFSTSLDEVIKRQRQLINKTRKLKRGTVRLEEQIATIDNLVSQQSELAGFTSFLIGRLAQQGTG